jgi:hypothetical protein
MSLIDRLYDRVEEARFDRKEHVEITRAEYEQLRDYLTFKADAPLPEGQGYVWGFPTRVVDHLSPDAREEQK